MSDFYYPSRGVLEYAVEGIREEAKKWFGLSDRMEAVARLAMEQNLEVIAFAVTDVSGPVTAFDLWDAYTKMHRMLVGLFGQAITAFDDFGAALNKCADWTEQADFRSAQSFDEIASR